MLEFIFHDSSVKFEAVDEVDLVEAVRSADFVGDDAQVCCLFYI